MTLETLADGSHVFHAPDHPYVSPEDPLGRTQAFDGASTVAPIPAVEMTQPVLLKDHDQQGYEVYSFSLTIRSMDGTWQQKGPFNEAHANFAENHLVGDGRDKGRHPFRTVKQGLSAGAIINHADAFNLFLRQSSTNYGGRMYTALMHSAGVTPVTPQIWQETSDTDPTMKKNTDYTPDANHFQITWLGGIDTGGADYLFVNYYVKAATGLGIEAYSTLASAPVQVDGSDGKTGGGSQPFGMIQSPNGDILMVDSSGDLRLAHNDVTPANLHFDTIQAHGLGPFAYPVGKVSLSNYAPGALWWTVIGDSSGPGNGFSGNNFQDSTPHGKLIYTSYDLLTLEPIDFPDLQWITLATIYRGGSVACDRESHFWYTGRSMTSLDGGLDRGANSYKYHRCCGHRVVGDKFLWIEAEIDRRFNQASPNSAYNTTARFIEYDPYKRRTRSVSKPIDLGWGGGSLIVGGIPELPLSQISRNVQSFYSYQGMSVDVGATGSDGSWLRQHQAPTNRPGYDERGTDTTATPGTIFGEPFEDACTYTSSEFWHPSLKGFELTPVRLIGPAVESLLTGGSGCYIDTSIGGYGPDATTRLNASEPDLKYPMVEYGDWPRRTWSTTLQLVLTSHLDPALNYGGGQQYNDFTPNVLPMTIDVIARRPLVQGIAV